MTQTQNYPPPRQQATPKPKQQRGKVSDKPLQPQPVIHHFNRF